MKGHFTAKIGLTDYTLLDLDFVPCDLCNFIQLSLFSRKTLQLTKAPIIILIWSYNSNSRTDCMRIVAS